MKAKKIKKVKLDLVEIDLSKGEKHEHPDINTKNLYLCRVDNQFETGYFSRQWYGLSFSGFYDAGLQFDAPGYNSSDWQQIWEIKTIKI
jgi:hypothetical protein